MNQPIASSAAARQKPRERKAPKKITPSYLHNAGLAYLERFPASSGHFRTILMRKVDRSCRHHVDQDRAACAEMVEKVVEQFQSMGLLNDAAYVRGMVTSLRRRGLSAAAITAKLMAKKLTAEVIHAALAQHRDDGGGEDMEAAVQFIRRKKLGPFRTPGKEPNRDKELAALGRAGFSYETASRALSMDKDEAEDILRALI